MNAARLPGNRLHLQHGPIDLVIGVVGDRDAAFGRAVKRFDGLLASLAAELPELRSPMRAKWRYDDPVAKRMARAALAFDGYVTPMIAVAGSVADEMLHALISEQTQSAYVNNGGDIAVHVASGHSLKIATPAGALLARHSQGIATSGWQGRSHSLGIADAVTVTALNAATADAAATLIANAVTLDHPLIARKPARELSPDSDLGDLPVTTAVPLLSRNDKDRALRHGLEKAQSLQGHIQSAALLLQGETRVLTSQTGHLTYA